MAWAYTRAGETQPALRALGQAHTALDATDGPPAPTWAYWVNREELEVMDARVFTELRRPPRAVPLLQDVLARHDATHAREVALYRSWPAVALADANEPEQAADEARRVIDTSGDLSSERTAARARTVLHRLKEYEDVPEARDVLCGYGHLLPAQARRSRPTCSAGLDQRCGDDNAAPGAGGGVRCVGVRQRASIRL
ncbi:hypothetical protein [Streptomyces sp. NPDC094031]|uniref:hypothetical protein n=1 Tax=Streptomyces sp. NPDC094031 TaxID=3155307 RepID=UPI00332E581E